MAFAVPAARRYRLLFAAALGVASLVSFAPGSAEAVSLEQACGMFASRLNAAVQAGDQAKAQTIYQEGTERIAQRFNGATCPNVQPPASN